jgi:site-specific DNA recombinase
LPSAYIRVSQERNARNGYGLEAQRADVLRYAEYKDLGAVRFYVEAGVSGYERDRPELERLLADARAGIINTAIFPSIDRAGRSVKDVIEIDAALREAGVKIVFLREGIDTSTPTGELFRNIMAAVAQFEGRLIYERMSKGKRRKAAGGGYTGGWLPYGYRLEGGGAVVVPEEAAVVKRLFRWRAKGLSLRAVCARLNAGEMKPRGGGKWRLSTVRGMLANRSYTGHVEFDDRPVRAQHEAIVSDVLFRSAATHDGRGKRRGL